MTLWRPRWDVVFLRLDGLAPTCWQSLGGLKEFMQCARRLRTGPRHVGYKTKFRISLVAEISLHSKNPGWRLGSCRMSI